MKHTKANVIKVLQAMSDNEWALAQYYEAENDEENRKRCVARMCEIDSVINLITDTEHFNAMCEIYKVTE